MISKVFHNSYGFQFFAYDFKWFTYDVRKSSYNFIWGGRPGGQASGRAAAAAATTQIQWLSNTNVNKPMLRNSSVDVAIPKWTKSRAKNPNAGYNVEVNKG